MAILTTDRAGGSRQSWRGGGGVCPGRGLAKPGSAEQPGTRPVAKGELQPRTKWDLRRAPERGEARNRSGRSPETASSTARWLRGVVAWAPAAPHSHPGSCRRRPRGRPPASGPHRHLGPHSSQAGCHCSHGSRWRGATSAPWGPRGPASGAAACLLSGCARSRTPGP